MARIALVNAPFQSHIAAMLRLGDVLSRQGHELIVWAPPPWRAQIEELGARFEHSSPEMPQTPGPGLAADLVATTERETEQLIPQLHGHDVDLVIRDSQTPWALVAAQYLGIPRIVSHPMFPMTELDATRDVATDPSPDAPETVDRDRFEQGWLSIGRRWGVELADVRGLFHRTSEPTLIFTTEEIVGDRELPPTWQCIGPLLSPAPPSPGSRPDPKRRRPLVYASLGTAQNRRTELFRLIIAALAEEPVQLLIATGGRRLTADDLGPLPANVDVFESVSAREVLARASVQITHGGCNSVHESLVAAVPMVCLPQAFDQIPLSRRVAQLGAGVIAEEDPRAVAGAVRSLLGDEETRRRVGAISARLRRYDGETRVAATVAASL